jgi:hemolysin activation/secretion protein
MCRLVFLAFFLSSVALAQSEAEQQASEQQASEQQASEQQAPAEDVSEGEAPPEAPGVKTLSGMSILGNEEAPKSLVIVPWKSSKIGDGLGVTNSMDDRARPVDREVFMREVHYYELRSGGAD